MAQMNAYEARFISADNLDYRDAKGHNRYRVYFQRKDSLAISGGNTRGYMCHSLSGLVKGDTVNVIFDGRGSIIQVEKVSDNA